MSSHFAFDTSSAWKMPDAVQYAMTGAASENKLSAKPGINEVAGE